MSIKVIKQVLGLELPPTVKLVLMVLASHLNEERGDDDCWPSIATLCRETGLTRRTVQRSIATLVELGGLSKREGVGESSRYTIRCATLAQRHSGAGVRHTGAGGCVTVAHKQEGNKKLTRTTPLSTSPPATVDPPPPLPETLPLKPDSRMAQATTVLAFLNARTGRYFRPDPGTLRPILNLLKAGFEVDELQAVVALKAREWSGNSEMTPYLRPSTLFGAEKFRQYVGEIPPREVSEGLAHGNV